MCVTSCNFLITKYQTTIKYFILTTYGDNNGDVDGDVDDDVKVIVLVTTKIFQKP